MLAFPDVGHQIGGSNRSGDGQEISRIKTPAEAAWLPIFRRTRQRGFLKYKKVRGGQAQLQDCAKDVSQHGVRLVPKPTNQAGRALAAHGCPALSSVIPGAIDVMFHWGIRYGNLPWVISGIKKSAQKKFPILEKVRDRGILGFGSLGHNRPCRHLSSTIDDCDHDLVR